MSRADRLSRLITKWQDDLKTLRMIEGYFREHQSHTCVEIAEFGRRILERCIADFQGADYPLDPPASVATMFSVNEKRAIADAVQRILRETNHPELPKGEIQFSLHVEGAESWSWADIRNNGAVTRPDVNPWNER